MWEQAGLLLLVVFGMLFPITATSEELYQKHCAVCHHPTKIGKTAPPLLSPILKKYSPEKLAGIILEGLPSTQMPPFRDQLKGEEVERIIAFLRAPVAVEWSLASVSSTLELASGSATVSSGTIPFKEAVVLVEKGNSKVWLLQGEKVVDTFPLANVHGGVKFDSRGRGFFVPTRDGWVARYDLEKGRYQGKIRPSIYLRNIALSDDDRFLVAASSLPPALVVLDSETLSPVRSVSLQGEPTAIYPLVGRPELIFSFKDQPELGLLLPETGTYREIPLEFPFEDFAIVPGDKFIIGSTRKGRALSVFDLGNEKNIAQFEIPAMPHLFSTAFFYAGGKFQFATPHIQKDFLTLWEMYPFNFIQNLPVGGSGFFVRSHPATPWLWADNGTVGMALVSKRDRSMKTIVPAPGFKVSHAGFSADGYLGYLSLGKNGGVAVVESGTGKVRSIVPAVEPAGKYNPVSNIRRFELPLLGRDIFMEKCWGCHHPSKEAFGPAFSEIARKRTPEWIRAQMADPGKSALHLGYQRSVMPQLQLKGPEMDALLAYIQAIPSGLVD